MSVGTWWRTAVRHLENLDLENKMRIIRRYPKRRILAIALILVFLIYVLSRSPAPSSPSAAEQCVIERLKHWTKKYEEFNIGIKEDSVKFVGNGHFGVDNNGQLRFNSNGSRVLDFESGFYPEVSSDIENTADVSKSELTAFEDGVFRKIQCFLVEGDCACVIVSTYAHRVRPSVFVQEMKIINPTRTSVRIRAERRTPPSDWRTMKTEETLRFICIVGQQRSDGKMAADALKDLPSQVIEEFTKVRALPTLDSEHTEAWNKLHWYFFAISPSKAPDVLNGNRINATKYIIMSNSKAPTWEIGKSSDSVKMLEMSARRNELCYTGHSTLLYPSRLWENWTDPKKLVDLAEIWLLTLEKRGCSNVLQVGAVGVSQAFVQSLSASSFHDSHLEVGLDAGDLHREIKFGGIPIGIVGTVTVHVQIDPENRPYLMVSSTGQLYACDGGCLDEPVLLTKSMTKIPVKVTKPTTSILYIASSRKHLEQLKSAIHVAEVVAAPAHEENLMELHRSGVGGGLPTSFWVLLGVVLVAFHLFLVKLLWSEWRKGDTTPYNPYLRSRYSSLRSH